MKKTLTETEARNIGTAFLRNKNFDLYNYSGERDKLGQSIDYNIFFSFTIVANDGGSYIGGRGLLIDKKTSFCLLVGGSNLSVIEMNIKFFRLIVINQLYDSEIDLFHYQKKKKNLDYKDYIETIFLLLESYPENFNAFSEFIDILVHLENTEHLDPIIQELSYKSLSLNSYTMDTFFTCLEIHKLDPRIVSQLEKLEHLLQKKNTSISIILDTYESESRENEDEIG